MKNLLRPYIIAEIGSNHDGSLDTAKRYIDRAALARVDAVKFQLFKADDLVGNFRPAFKPGTEIYETYKKLELSYEQIWELKRHAEGLRLDFICSPFSIGAAKFLRDIGCKIIKIASSEALKLELMAEVMNFHDVKLLIATGGFRPLYKLPFGTLRQGDILLYCVSQYPCRHKDFSLHTFRLMKERFGRAGISDHTLGISIALAATTLQASVIEKHVTFDRTLPGPDHSYAITWEECDQMVQGIWGIADSINHGWNDQFAVDDPALVDGRNWITPEEFAKRVVK